MKCLGWMSESWHATTVLGWNRSVTVTEAYLFSKRWKTCVDVRRPHRYRGRRRERRTLASSRPKDPKKAPPLLLASSSSSSVLILWSRSEMRKRGDTTEATRETRYVMPYYCCFLERWTWVSLRLLSSSLYRSASNTIYIFEAAQWLFTCTTRKSEFPEDPVFCSEQFVRWKQGILEDREREEEESEQE